MPEKKVPSGINVNIFHTAKSIRCNKNKIIELIQKTLKIFKIRKAQINIEIANDRRIIEVNKKFLKRKSITDVISFDVSDSKEKSFDIIVNAHLAQREAKKRGHSISAELALYILHGLLHQLGFDDLKPQKALKMHKKEDEILRKLGYGVVYGSAKR